MFRFTIRDMLLLMVIVGLAVGWWLDRSRLAAGNRQQMEWVRFYEREGFSRPSGFAFPPGRVPGS